MRKVTKVKSRARQPGEVATLSVAIRSFCLECYCDQVEAITYCTEPECWCYPYRLDCTTRAKLGRLEIYVEKEKKAFVAARPDTPLPSAIGKYAPVCLQKEDIAIRGKVRIERAHVIPRRPREVGEILGRGQTIRAFCLECHGWEEAETRKCTRVDCWFFPYRLSSLAKTRAEIEAETSGKPIEQPVQQPVLTE